MPFTRTYESPLFANTPHQTLKAQNWPRLIVHASLAALAVTLTTCGLRLLSSLTQAVDPHVYVRPYIGLFVVTILLMTWIGGRSLGFFTLILSSLTSLYFLIPPPWMDSITLLGLGGVCSSYFQRNGRNLRIRCYAAEDGIAGQSRRYLAD